MCAVDYSEYRATCNTNSHLVQYKYVHVHACMTYDMHVHSTSTCGVACLPAEVGTVLVRSVCRARVETMAGFAALPPQRLLDSMKYGPPGSS